VHIVNTEGANADTANANAANADVRKERAVKSKTAKTKTAKTKTKNAETAGTAPVFVTQYDVLSKKRYVDSTSQKSEFEKVLDELESLGKDALSWEIEKMAQEHFVGAKEEDARKTESFLGAFIINAATELYDRGMPDAAFRKLEQAMSILEAKQKLEQEAESLRAKLEEMAIDVTDLLEIFDD
jgi:hypothetical protein